MALSPLRTKKDCSRSLGYIMIKQTKISALVDLSKVYGGKIGDNTHRRNEEWVNYILDLRQKKRIQGRQWRLWC